MQLKKILDSRLAAVVAGGAVIAVLGASAGFAAATINSADIVDDSIKSKDIQNGTLKQADLSDGATRALSGQDGARGPAGADGATGPAGPAGAQGPAGPAGGSNVEQVTDLTGEWTVRAADVSGASLTGDGIQFGPFANDGACAAPGGDYARVDFSGLNGEPLSSLTGLSYRAQHVADTDTEGYGAIPMRVFFDDPATEADDRLTFSPNTQFGGAFNYGVDQGSVNEYLVTSGTVRLNDDSGDNPAGEDLFAAYVEDLGDFEITNINFLGGCSGSGTTNLRQIVTEVEVNGTVYSFGTEG